MADYPRNGEGRVIHVYLTDGVGAPLAFIRMTDEACPSCATPHGGRIGVLFETNTSQTVHCQRCDYQYARPPKDPLTRRMNQRG